jgi:2-methylcitrate dehydratase PrpD
MKESLALAKYIFETNYENLPRNVAEVTKKALLDGIGVTLGAGTLGEGCRAFVDLAIQGGGKKESTIIGFNAKVPSYMAAFANGSMAHALDFEDAHEGALVHSNAATIPAALAVAESMETTSGRELITAITLGSDIVCRMGLSLEEDLINYGWYHPAILDAFGATAAASKLLKLTPEQIIDAFSLCLCQATCSGEIVYSPKSVIRAVRESFGAKTGVLSAILAKERIRGFDEPLEGKAGFFNLYAKGKYDAGILLRDLGTLFESANIAFKAWPSCRGTHAYVEGALAIVKEHSIKLADIDSVKVFVGEKSINRRLCEPLENKQHPSVAIDAKFSIPFTVATVLVRKTITLDSFTPQALKDADVLKMAEKVTYGIDTNLERSDSVQGYTEIKLKNGETKSKNVEFVYGHPKNPIDAESLVAKFINCASHSVKKISRKSLEKVVAMVMTLENLEDIRELMKKI